MAYQDYSTPFGSAGVDYSLGAETEEQRRRRLAAEAAAMEPVKQTITYNPDGTQEVTIKGTPEALSPINPNTPTLYAPGENAAADRFAQQATATEIPVMPMAPAQPSAQVAGAMQIPTQMPVDREQQRRAILQSEAAKIQQQLQTTQDPATIERLQRDAAALQREMSRVPPGIQRVSAPAPQAQPRPQAQSAPQAQAQAQPAPVAPTLGQPPASYVLGTGQGNQGIRIPGLTPVTQMPTPADQTAQMITRYQNIQDNPEELMKLGYSQDPAVPEFLRTRARNRTAELITQQREMDSARQQIPTMSETEIARALREKTSGGSYLKAALFGLLGMDQSAQAEAAKLGLGKETLTQINGQPAMVKMAANGTPIEGYNATTGKKLSAEELVAAAQYASLQKGAQTHTGKMQDMRTGEVYYERTTPQGIELVDNQGKRYTGSSANLRPFGIGSDIQTKNQIQLNELQNKLAYAGPTERARIVAENEAKFGPLDPAVRAQALGAVSGTIPVQQTQAPGSAPAMAPAPAQARPAGAVAPTAMPPAGTPVVGQTIAQREAAQKGQEKEATVVGEDIGKVRAALPQTERTAESMLKTIESVISHPGFETNVGVRGPTGILQLRGTEARDWTAKYDQLMGQQFLTAFNQLRGGGSISEKEGDKAEQAIAALKDPGISEAEFKRNAKILTDVIKNGINDQRKKIGLDPKYSVDTPVATSTETLTPQQRAAAEIERRRNERR